MNKRITIGLVAVGLLIIAGVLVFRPHAPRAPEITRTPPPPKATDAARQPGSPARPTAVRPKPGEEPASAAAPKAAPIKPTIDSTAPVDPVKRAEVETVLAEQKKIYGDAGTLSWDETKALVAKRRKAGEDLVERLARLGPGGARAIASVYTAGGDTRTKLLLVAALGRIGDQEASAVLDGLMNADNSFSLRKEMVAALGKRQEPASAAVLTGILQSQEDPRLRAMSVQGLSGRAEALPVLSERIRTDASLDVRMESIRSVGLIGNQAARDALAGIAQGSMETPIRQTAIQELGRSFGESALGVFDSLLNDPNETIRQSTVKGIARVHTDGAVALLKRTASSDSSSAIRDQAKLSLPTGP